MQKQSRRFLPRRKLARILVRPPVRPSEGAQTLSRLLGADAVLSRRSPIPRQFHTVVNWGNTELLVTHPGVRVCNTPFGIRSASNKLTAFNLMQSGGVRVPAFFNNTRWAINERTGIYLARTVLTGSCGVGIVVVRPGEPLPEAPLYVKYIKKVEELRIHVVFGKAIFLQYKKRQSGAEQTADQKLIRNHDNGWVFCPRPLEQAPQDCLEQAVNAVAALGLDFGAVDLVISNEDGMPYVLEVNTAPGIESPTLAEAYRAAFAQELLSPTAV